VGELFAKAREVAGDQLGCGHFHDTRGLGLSNVMAALQAGETRFDACLAGIGGCPHAPGASGNVATEDLTYLMASMGVDTGIDLNKIIDCVWMLEKMVGHAAFGHVSKAGPRPIKAAQFYDPNLPAIESLQAARHFKLGSAAYAGQTYSPWKQAITGPWFQGPSENT
jgi:hypothetical protein